MMVRVDPHYLFGCYHDYSLKALMCRAAGLSDARRVLCMGIQAWHSTAAWRCKQLFNSTLSSRGAEKRRLLFDTAHSQKFFFTRAEFCFSGWKRTIKIWALLKRLSPELFQSTVCVKLKARRQNLDLINIFFPVSKGNKCKIAFWFLFFLLYWVHSFWPPFKPGK